MLVVSLQAPPFNHFIYTSSHRVNITTGYEQSPARITKTNRQIAY